MQNEFLNSFVWQSCDSVSFYGADQKSNSLFVKMTHRGYHITELILQVTLSDGRIYVLPGKDHLIQKYYITGKYNILMIHSF